MSRISLYLGYFRDRRCWRIQAASASRAKCEQYVSDLGSSPSHARALFRLIAAAVATC